MERQGSKSQTPHFPKINNKRSLSKDISNKAKYFNSPYNRLPMIKLNKTISSSHNSLPSNSINTSSLPDSIPETDIIHLLDELRFHKVPSSLIEIYSNLINSISYRRASKFITCELTDISNKSSILLQCIKSYSSWKDSLNTVQEMAEFLGKNPGWVKLKDVVNECASSLSTHVLLALNVSELVLSWKEHVRLYLPIKGQVKFIMNETEFYNEFLTSCDFLTTSPIFPAFSVTKNDPFLLSVIKEIPAHKKNAFNFSVEKNKIYLNMGKKVIDRIKIVTGELEKEESLKLLQPTSNSNTVIKKSIKISGNNHKTAKLFTDRIINDSISSIISQLANQAANEEIASSIQSKFTHNLSEILQAIVKQAIIEVESDNSSKKAHKLHTINIIESIIRNLIEEEIQALNLESICDEEIKLQIQIQSISARDPEAKRRLTRISLNFNNERLSDLIFHSVIDSFIHESWLVQLAENSFQFNKRKTIVPLVINNKTVQEVEDFALEVFTPGVHSPNHISDDEEKDLEESLQDIVKAEVPKKQFSSLAINAKLIEVEGLKEEFAKLNEVVGQYFEQLPGELKCCLGPDEVLLEAGKCLNAQFYWILYDKNICGFYCYSFKDGKILVHHLSCLNVKFLDQVVANFTNFAGFVSDAVAIQLKAQASQVKVLTTALKKSGFSPGKEENGLVEYLKPGKAVNLWKFSLRSICSIETSNACPFNQKTSPQMTQIGNRHSIISLILHLLKDTPDLISNFEETPIRLHQDLNELLEIIFSLNFRSYSHISVQSRGDLSQRCLDLSLNSKFSHLNPSAFAVIDLNFHLKSVQFVSHAIEDTEYRYLMFNSNEIQVKSEDSTLMFIIQTLDPDFSIFFIKSPNIRRELNQGLKMGKTDLFYNIDNLIKALQDEQVNGQLWVPCFGKEALVQLPWVEGYNVETSSGNLVLASCEESLKTEFEYLGKSNLSLKASPGKKYLIDDDFVFGVYSKQVLESIESPFYVMLVGKEEFVKLGK